VAYDEWLIESNKWNDFDTKTFQDIDGDSYPKDVIDYYTKTFQDIDGVSYLKDVIDYYMIEPVGKYKDQLIQAKSAKVYSIVELKNWFKDIQGTKILYQLRFCPGYPQYTAINLDSFETVVLDVPIMQESHWLLRYFISDASLD
jgi:hypothetical protein